MAVQSTDTVNPLIRLVPSLSSDDGSIVIPAPMIGRLTEMAAIRSLLTDSGTRLVVITGPGGVGKTRLAASIAEVAQEDFSHGVVMVNLAQVRSSSLVLPAIATALGIHEQTDGEFGRAVLQKLEHLAVLLILDNFEHVSAAAPLLTELLAETDHLTILVTSRVVLDVYGEHIYPVPPMHVPDADDASGLDAIGVQQFEAVQLFVDRARAVDASFQLQDRDVPGILHIVRQLDGLPLAIELAASRVNAFSLSELADKLTSRLTFLVNTSRLVPNRLRTMRNAIAWSYDLLTPDERAAFRRLSTLIGSWTVENAVVISQISPAAPHAWEPRVRSGRAAGSSAGSSASSSAGMAAVWTSIAAATATSPSAHFGPAEESDDLETRELIASLVDKSLIRQVDGAGDLPHFEMLETLREFGLEQLEATHEFNDTMERYAWHLLEFAESAAPQLTGVDQVHWLDRLTELKADIGVAFGWFSTREPIDLALRMAIAVWRVGYTRGQITESLMWIEEALVRATDRTALRADALNAAGVLVNMQGHVDRAEHLHQEALEIGYENDHPHAVGMAFLGLGEIAVANGNHDEAQWMLEEADKVLVHNENQRTVAVAKTNLGNLLWSMGSLDRAVAVHAESKVLYEAIGDERGIAWAKTNIGRIAAERQDYGGAVANLQEAIFHYDNLNDRSGIAETLEGLAEVAQGLGDQLRAATLLGAADALRVILNHPVPGIDSVSYQHLMATIRAQDTTAFERGWDRGHVLSLQDATALGMGIVVSSEKPFSSTSIPSQFNAAGKRPNPLTSREMDVLGLLRSGTSDREIGEQLFIGVRTAQTHVSRIIAKLGVNSRSAAVARAIRDGLI